MAWRLKGYPRPRRSPIMKNFARLVRYAWPYRVRFGLSLLCAGLVALLWGANIGAVYPLLRILFYESQNAQTWVAEKVDSIETQIQTLGARIEEVDLVAQEVAHNGPRNRALTGHFEEMDTEVERRGKVGRDLQKKINPPAPPAPP